MSALSAAAARAPDPFAPARVFARIAERLPKTLDAAALDATTLPRFGDHALNDWAVSPEVLAQARAAAVLVPLVVRGSALTVLMTERTASLRAHPGQIAFPGGAIDPADTDAAAAARREAWEEIGLPADRITTLGYLGAYLTRTGYRIIPVVARVDPPFELRLNAAEVASSFEVPFATLMDAARFALEQREWMGRMRSFYATTVGDRRIWGITAGILRVLSDELSL